MKMQSTNKPWLFITGNLFIPTVIALTFLVFTFFYYPFREEIEFDTDEGLNLMRSMLVVLDHPLYSEVSSDQPPLFTLLLVLLLRVVGFKVAPARFLVLLFSTLLVWSCAQFLQLTWGKLSAILFLPLVIMTPRFMVLSVSVMIGVPSIALAALSMVLVTLWHKQKNSLWLVLSGFALAFSVLIKLFTGFVAVIFLVGITISAYLENRENGLSWKMLQPALLWGLCFAGVTIVLGLALVGPQNVSQIIFPHVEAINKMVFQDESYTINYHLRAAVRLLVLGFFGALLSIYTRNWLALYPLAWAALTYTLFSFYSPVFYHHQLLITVPFAMMAAAFVGEGLIALFRIRQTSDLVRPHTIMGIVALVGFGWVTLNYLPKLDQQLMDRPRISGFSLHASAGRIEVIRAMNEYINQTNWILTDTPMYAFIVQRPVPPSLATFSKKRWVTGSLTEAEILAAMREYKPEQVLMRRFVIPGLEAYLHDKYTLIVSPKHFRLFIRNDLLSPPK
jgi:4-amino-4-deoxy-L-arabinose transferase-like glycosyltransferase